MSPLLRPAREIGERAVSRKSRPWEITPEDFFEDAEESRTLFARIVGGDADGVAIIPAVSYGIAVAAANVPVEEGQRILILEEQFPSNVYPWRELASRRGAELVTVQRPPDHDWTRAVLAELDERAAVVSLPNCHWTDGSLVDLVRIGARAREVGAALVVDAIQSLGALPFDVSEVGPDFLVGRRLQVVAGSLRGRVYVRRGALREGTPIEHNWINRRDSENFPGSPTTGTTSSPGPAATTSASGVTSSCCRWRTRRCASSSIGASRTSRRPPGS